MFRVVLLAVAMSACSRMPPKRVEHPDQCFHTSAHKDWIDPSDCRKFDDVAPVFVPEPEDGGK